MMICRVRERVVDLVLAGQMQSSRCHSRETNVRSLPMLPNFHPECPEYEYARIWLISNLDR